MPHCALKTLNCCVCLWAFGLAAFISLSIPFNTLPYYSYIAQIAFNEAMFTGSVNQFSVQNITELRLGGWAGSYDDIQNTDMKMPGCLLGYEIDFTNDNSTPHTTGGIVQKFWTLFQWFTVCLVLSTLLMCFRIPLTDGLCFPTHSFVRYYTAHWIVEIAVFFSSLFALLGNGVLFYNVQSKMQNFGETIVTTMGPAFFLIGIVDFLVLVEAFLNRHLVKQIANSAASANPKADGGPKTSTLTINNPPALMPPPGISLTPYQRVQALMPPRHGTAPAQAVHQQAQGSMAPGLLPQVRRRAQYPRQTLPRGRTQRPRHNFVQEQAPSQPVHLPSAANASPSIPLPENWDRRYDYNSKRTYYVDHNTKTSHWYLPPTLTDPPPNAPQGLRPSPASVPPNPLPDSIDNKSAPLSTFRRFTKFFSNSQNEEKPSAPPGDLRRPTVPVRRGPNVTSPQASQRRLFRQDIYMDPEFGIYGDRDNFEADFAAYKKIPIEDQRTFPEFAAERERERQRQGNMTSHSPQASSSQRIVTRPPTKNIYEDEYDVYLRHIEEHPEDKNLSFDQYTNKRKSQQQKRKKKK